jgi:hypothetical protein
MHQVWDKISEKFLEMGYENKHFWEHLTLTATTILTELQVW